MSKYDIKDLLQEKADLTARIKLLPYDGTPEIKKSGNRKHIYIRKRIGSKLTSKYVSVYSEDTFNVLLKQSKELRELKKQLRAIEKKLVDSGYNEANLNSNVILNMEFARSNIKKIIYDQAILEGVSTTFPQTENIIENGKVRGMKPDDIQKIINLKHSWEFILDKDLLSFPTNLDVLKHIAKLVNEGFYDNGGRIRTVPVKIGGSTYEPPLPFESIINEEISKIVHKKKPALDIAVELCLYCMKKQIFIDGNKRSAVIFANHFLISKGKGLLIIDERLVNQFRILLIDYYEGNDKGKMIKFLKNKCYLNIKSNKKTTS